MTTHWRPTRDGGEWMPAEADPYTTTILRNVGIMVKDGWKYQIIHDGQTIYRKRCL